MQFPAAIGPEDIGFLNTLFNQLPHDYRYVLEVRHPEFLSQPQLLEPLLEKFRFGRVMMDTRAVFSGDRSHPEVLEALHNKPDLPVLETVYNGLVFVRLLLHPDLTSNTVYIDQWVNRVVQALTRGWDCYMMIHCPNKMHCPELAGAFQRALCAHSSMGHLSALPPWPLPQQVRLL